MGASLVLQQRASQRGALSDLLGALRGTTRPPFHIRMNGFSVGITLRYEPHLIRYDPQNGKGICAVLQVHAAKEAGRAVQDARGSSEARAASAVFQAAGGVERGNRNKDARV